MNTYEISVKNLYRILTVKDYPIYTEGVLTDLNRKGLTLTRFCEMILVPEWKSGPLGKMIWRTDGSWNRYHSEICNRSPRFAYYRDYSAEILGKMNQQLFLKEISMFETFLKEREYQHEVLLKKIRAYLEEAKTGDVYALPDIIEFLNSCSTLYGKIPEIYLDSWTLTALFIHSITGTEMAASSVDEFRKCGLYDPKILYEQYRMQNEETGSIFATNRMSEIMREGVPEEFFFGREQELFELTDSFYAKEKVLVTGIGGIGKTELIRHLFRLLIKREQCGMAAEVQYTGGLAESFVRAFPDAQGNSAEERFSSCVKKMDSNHGKPAVLVIDNAEYHENEAAAWNMLSKLGCAVFVTSRHPEIPGFKTFSLDLLDDKPSMLLIRSHYGKVLSDDEKKTLKEVLKFDELRHPLTISMIGRAARFNNWSIGQIVSGLEKGAGEIAWPENGTEYKLALIYRTLYRANALNEIEKSVIRLLSVIPYRSYPPGLIAEASFGSSRTKDAENELFDRLYRTGWIILTETGVSMHPLVADCVRGSGFTEWDFSEFWNHADQALGSFNGDLQEASRDMGEISGEYARMLVHAAVLLRGDLSARLFGLYLRAYQRLLLSLEEGSTQRKQLLAVSRRCPGMTEQQREQLASLIG